MFQRNFCVYIATFVSDVHLAVGHAGRNKILNEWQMKYYLYVYINYDLLKLWRYMSKRK
jgi:hypothetical protein